MKRILILFIGLILFNVMIISSMEEDNLEFNKGMNNLSEVYFEPIYVKDFVEINPEIRSITYTVGGITYGYVNVFGGIGINFILRPDLDYKIVTSKNITVKFR